MLIFPAGLCNIRRFLGQTNSKIPENLAERQALRDLLQFLSNANEHSVVTEKKGKYKSEAGIALAIRLAQHLLIPLVPNNTFLIDSFSTCSPQSSRCCPVEHPMNGVKGDTSFGCPNGWHGCSDVLLLGNDVPLTVFEGSDNDAVSITSDTFELNKSGNFTTESLSQLIAQTLVHSFVQQRKKPTLPCSLIPGIGICSKKMIVCLYDCVDDILLTTGPVDLYAQMGLFGLNARAIIILWLILNFHTFSNKTPERYKAYTAAFHHVLGPVQLEAYKSNSEQPLNTMSDMEDLVQVLKEEHVSFEDDLTEEKNVIFPERKSVSLK